MAGLKNLTRIEASRKGRTTWLLLDNAGTSIEAFSNFCEKNWDYAFTTQKRYAEVVSQFIDYLIEADAFGSAVAPTKRYLNAVIDAYPLLLRDGSSALEAKVRPTLDEHPEDAWLANVCQSMNRRPLKPASFSNTLAGINRFLRLSELLAIEAFERAALKGIAHEESYHILIEALSGVEALSASEKQNMRMNSVLGSVMRLRSQGLTRPRRLSISAGAQQSDVRHLDFPIDHVFHLANAATVWRDQALWLLLAASGIRVSEALNLQWSDIDSQNQKVYIYDPSGRRFGGDMTTQERIRFKGRQTSSTYLIQPFRQAFFQALEQYLKQEYVTPRDAAISGYVFQYVEHGQRGQPYRVVSDSALNKSFKAACDRAAVPSPQLGSRKQWTTHSLRHLYGVYMVNDFPVDAAIGRYGLELAEVQVLMGHKSINSTRCYARKKRRSIENKLIQVDKYLLELPDQQLLAIPRNQVGE